MIKQSKNILFCIFAVVFGVISMTAADKKSTVSEADIAKANYIYLEALRQNALGNQSSFYELLKHAYSIDSTNTAVAYYLGYSAVIMDNTTAADVTEGAALMGKHFAKHPDDYFEGYTYGRVLTGIGKHNEAMAVWEKMSTLFPQKLDVQGERADSYARNGEFRKAIEAFDSIENSLGQSMEVSLRKLAFYFQLGDTTGLIKEAKKLLKTAPKNVDYNMLMGSVYDNLHMGDSALVYYDNAIKLAPDDGRAYLAKATYYAQSGDSINYDKQIYNALISKDLDVENKIGVLTGYIKELFARQDTTERVNRLFKVLIEQHPHESEIHDLYGEYFIARQDYVNAAEQLQYALDIDPSDADNWKRLMMVDLMAEKFPEAVAAAEKALEYNPDNIDLYQYIAPAYYQMKEYDKAIDLYELCLTKADSTDYTLQSNVYGGMGDVYYALGDTIKAFANYDKSLEINPNNISILNNYAYFLAVSGTNLDKAERMSALAVKGAPENSTFLDTYAWVFFKKGEYKLALAYIEYAIKNDKNPNYELWEHYGDILFMNSNPDKAIECWEKALSGNPDSEILQRKVKHRTYFYK